MASLSDQPIAPRPALRGSGAKTDSDLARLPGVDHPAGRTDSDLARPPGGDHPAAQHASQGVLTRSAARRGQSAAQRAHPRPSDTECSTQRLEDAASRTTRGLRRGGSVEERPAGVGPGQEDRAWIRADDVYPEGWRSITKEHNTYNFLTQRRRAGH